MDIIRKMRSHYQEMTVAEKKVYDTIIADPSLVPRFTISQIAMLSDTSTSAVMRFCRRVGCAGYKEFHYEILNHLRKQENLKKTDSDLVNALVEEYMEAVSSLKNLDRTLLYTLRDDILNADKVILLGRHRNKSIISKLAMGLTDLGIVCLTGSDELDFLHLLYLITPKTCVIIFTSLGVTKDLSEFFRQFPGKKCSSWLITNNPFSQASAHTKHTVILPSIPPGTDSHITFHPVMMVFTEILTACIGEKQDCNPVSPDI